MSSIFPLNQKTSNKGIISVMVSIYWSTEVRKLHTNFIQLAMTGMEAQRDFLGGKTVLRDKGYCPILKVIENSKTHLLRGLASLPSFTTIILVLFSFKNCSFCACIRILNCHRKLSICVFFLWIKRNQQMPYGAVL